MKKFILLLLPLMLLVTGCVGQHTTLKINDDFSAVVEKSLITTGVDSLGSSDVIKKLENYFVENLHTQKPESVMRFKDTDKSGIKGTFKVADITKQNVFAADKYIKAKNDKSIKCTKLRSYTECVISFDVDFRSEELSKVLTEQGVTYADLDPFVLTIELPVEATESNAPFFDKSQQKYIWEIPIGEPNKVYLKFSMQNK